MKAFSILLLFLALSVVSSSHDDCLLGPLPQKLAEAGDCIDVRNDWERFRSAVKSAVDGDSLVFCPFRVNKDGDPAKPTAKSTFACQREGACVIRGGSQHIVVNHRMAETLFWGFVFESSVGESAFRVRDDSQRPQKLCKCIFRDNSGQTRGSAIRAERDTHVIVSHSSFRYNTASRGGAIYNRGIMKVSFSIFVGNQASQGGALAFASYGSLEVEGNQFQDNHALSGPVVYGEAAELVNHYTDAGGNIATSTSCNGIFNRVESSEVCYEFDGSVFEPSLSPSKLPTRSLSPTPAPTSIDTQRPSMQPSISSTVVPFVSAAPTSPSTFPTLVPSRIPSGSSSSPSHSVLPSLFPSYKPSFSSYPSVSLSDQPSTAPSLTHVLPLTPSSAPSSEPTSDSTKAPTSYTPPLDPLDEELSLVDRNQAVGYYNFNIEDPDFGPYAWWKVDVSSNEYSRYGDVGLDVSVNECASDSQSPINLHDINRACSEFHQIRAKGGDWRNLTNEGEITFHVLPSHLRIQFDSENPKAPRADSPGGFTELYTDHVEIVAPSLHTVSGKRYDAEYSIYHVQGKLNRVLIMSVVIDASENIYNNEFQKVLNAFGDVGGCGLLEGRRLRLQDLADEDDYLHLERPMTEAVERLLAEEAKISRKFNLYNIHMVPSLYWFAYGGSLPRVSLKCNMSSINFVVDS